MARSAHIVPRPIAASLALAPGSRQRWNLPPGALVATSAASSPSAETAPLWNYWKYNSKAVNACRRKFSPTAIVLTTLTRRPTWRMRPFDLPLGYKYATTYAGIRKQEKDDLALIVSGVPAAAAAVFTTNKVQAAPVKLARSNMRASKGVCGAILINAGNANCATKTGDKVVAEHHQGAGEAAETAAQSGAARFDRRDRRGTG